MTIDILSDIHIDMWHDPDSSMNERKYDLIFGNLFPEKPGQVLVIAGDLGHYHKQNIDLLKRFQDKYGYKIVYVWGNHDFYRVSKSQERTYTNAIMKAEEIRHMINDQEGMYHLDGEVVEIDRVKFGGCNGWYDGSLFFDDGSREEINYYWRQWMNDSRIKLFYTGKDLEFDTLHKLDLPKIEKIHTKCDVMVTHVCPIADKTIFEEVYGEFQPVRTFYCFDGEKYVKNGSMKVWIFGHIHKPFHQEYYGKQLVCNPLGRRRRSKPMPIIAAKQIEVLPVP